MSETATPGSAAPTPTIPSAAPSDAAPGPMVGTPAPAAGAEAAPAPAPVSSPEPAAPAPAEAPAAPDTSDSPSSLLGAAAPADPAAPPQEAAAAPAPDAAVPPPAPQAPAPSPAPSYEPFTLPEGVTVAEDRIGAFTSTLGEFETRLASNPAEAHKTMQEFGQRMLDLHLAELQATAQREITQRELNWTRTQEQWVQQFRADPEIGRNQQDTTLARAGAMISLYGQREGAEHETALRDAFNLTGAGNHPELLRFMNWAASFAIERPRMVAAQVPRGPQPGSRATRLYRNSVPMNGAS